MNKPPYGTAIRDISPVEMLKVSAQDKPNLTVKINAGTFILSSGSIVEYSGGNSPTIAAPTTGNLWYLVSLGPTSNIVITNNATNPPAVARNHLGLAIVYVRSVDTVISNDMIFDVRPIYSNTSYPINHSDVLLSDAANSHPISAITGLQLAIDSKLSIADSVNELALKADIDGTTSSSFILNKDHTGDPTESTSLVVERGNETNVSIRWSESANQWEFTNDGTEFFAFSNSGSVANATVGLAGRVKLSVAPADPALPIAVGDNDPRLQNLVSQNDLTGKANTTDVYLKTAVDTLLAAKADQTAVYSKGEVNTELALKANLSTTFTKSEVTALVATKADADSSYTKAQSDTSLGLKADLSTTYTKTESDALLADKADSANTYSKSEVDTALGLKAGAATTYNKTEVDGFLADKAAKQVGISGSFTTNDGKTITVVDGMITSIV